MIWYVVFDPETGVILKFGISMPDDLAVHGPHVLAFEADQMATDRTHRVDPATRTLIQIGR